MKVFLIACEQEAAAIIHHWKPIINKENTHNLKLYYFAQQNCYLVITNIGLVNAAISCQKTINFFTMQNKITQNNPLELINLGFGGGSANLVQGDYYLINYCAYDDFDLQQFGHQPGQVPGSCAIFTLTKWDYSVINGPTAPVLSLNSFVSPTKKVKNHWKWKNFLVDMELTALAHTVEKNLPTTPIVLRSIKVVSDLISQNNNHLTYLQETSKLSQQLLFLFHQITNF